MGKTRGCMYKKKKRTISSTMRLFVWPDLIDLTWPDLILPDLIWCDLTRSDLTWSDLIWPDLTRPKVQRCVLRLSICPSVHLSVCLSVCLSVRLSVCVCLSVRLSVRVCPCCNAHGNSCRSRIIARDFEVGAWLQSHLHIEVINNSVLET